MSENKKNLIEERLNHIRKVQDNMIYLEENLDKLPFKINDWELFRRGMQHDLDKFSKELVNGFLLISEYHKNKKLGLPNNHIDKEHLYDCCNTHYSTQPHHIEYHIKNKIPISDIDICEICCDISAVAERNNENDFVKFYKENFLKEYQILLDYDKNIIKILKLLENKNNFSTSI